jgi:hypothetical protein
MKRYTVSGVRERLAEALDAAERGVPVVIERKGVRYRLSLDAGARPRTSRRPARVQVLDPDVEDGRWTWRVTGSGLAFRQGRRR